MIWIYIAAAIFGGGFVLPTLFGGVDADVDFGTGGDIGDLDLGDVADVGDVDVDTDFDTDAETQAVEPSIVGDWVASLLTFRSIVMVSAFFGLVGIVLTALDYSTIVTLVFAVALGLFAGLLNARLMAFLQRTDHSGNGGERHLNGSLGRVVLPIGDHARGRVEVDIAGQPIFLNAEPFRSGAEDLAPGDPVIVVEVKDGTAFVVPNPQALNP
ncbi:MAG: NfeD family protein [Actinomycetota bacterium]